RTRNNWQQGDSRKSTNRHLFQKTNHRPRPLPPHPRPLNIHLPHQVRPFLSLQRLPRRAVGLHRPRLPVHLLGLGRLALPDLRRKELRLPRQLRVRLGQGEAVGHGQLPDVLLPPLGLRRLPPLPPGRPARPLGGPLHGHLRRPLHRRVRPLRPRQHGQPRLGGDRAGAHGQERRPPRLGPDQRGGRRRVPVRRGREAGRGRPFALFPHRQSFTARKLYKTSSNKSAKGSDPIASLPSTYSVHEFHNYGLQGSGISPGLHFHLSGTINARTDIPLVPAMSGGSGAFQHNFVLHWLNNKEMQFTMEAERIMDDLFKLALERDEGNFEFDLIDDVSTLAESDSGGGGGGGGGFRPNVQRPPIRPALRNAATPRATSRKRRQTRP
ncbi:unnamed protein product, partial [Sphagnum tenellum]